MLRRPGEVILGLFAARLRCPEVVLERLDPSSRDGVTGRRVAARGLAVRLHYAGSLSVRLIALKALSLFSLCEIETVVSRQPSRSYSYRAIPKKLAEKNE